VSDLRSALIVAVPEAAAAVDEWRERTCAAKPSSGVPAHVTLIFPFVPVTKIDDALIEDLGTLFGRFDAFAFELREAKRFPAVLYLAPEPAENFVRLTEALAVEYPGFRPYEGVFDSIVPHVTVAEGEPEILDKVERDVRRSLPISAEASEVILLEEAVPDSARWQTRARLPLGAPS
jgi:2'-5' RNA ligase